MNLAGNHRNHPGLDRELSPSMSSCFIQGCLLHCVESIFLVYFGLPSVFLELIKLPQVILLDWIDRLFSREIGGAFIKKKLQVSSLMLSWNGKTEGEGQVDIGFRTARSLFRLTSRRENDLHAGLG